MQTENSLWSVIPADEFDPPAAPAGDAALGTMVRFWKSVRSIFHQPSPETPVEDPDWIRLSQPEMARAVPDIPWKQAAAVLGNELADSWLDPQCAERPLRALVGPPGWDVAQVLEELAVRQRLHIISPPAAKAILEGGSAHLSQLQAIDETQQTLVVIPRLERWFLRHQDGLGLVRGLVDHLGDSRRKVLLGCNSWAWAFLKASMGLESIVGHAMAFAPFEARRLDSLMRERLDLQSESIRHGSEGALVFSECDDSQTKDAETEPKVSSLLKSLAAKARGNPGVAWALWRASLRRRTVEQVPGRQPEQSGASDLWVVPPTEVHLPEVPVGVDRVHRFVLHSVLLHGGIPLSLLYQLLPFSKAEILSHVRSLLRSSILEEQHGILHVTLTSYPSVRHNLQSEGFLADDF